MNFGPGVEHLFAYGTLQLPQAQLDTFGRALDGEDDSLPGYRREWVEIDDDRVTRVSGMDAHPILRRTDDPRDRVFGRVLALTPEEIDAADEYEVSVYRRVAVELSSGLRAWVYVGH